MSWKDWFVKPEVGSGTSVPDKPPVRITGPSKITANTNGSFTGVDTTDFDVYFDKVMKAANLPGPDFYEFHKGLDSLKGQPMPEATKYQAVFAPLNVQGLTRAKLIESAAQYRQILNTESSQFENELSGLTDREVTVNKRNAEELKLKNDLMAKEIEALSAQMQKNLEQIGTCTAAAEDNKKKIDGKRLAFATALANRLNHIDNVLNEVQLHLK